MGDRHGRIVTRMTFCAPIARAWDGLLFFEELAERPPAPLRLLLPLPLRVEGRKCRVGDEARCLYDRGELVKQVTRIEVGRRICFDIVEQRLELGGGVRLLGGSYLLRPVSKESTEVELETRYVGARRPRWLWQRVEVAVGHLFHRHMLRAMRKRVERSAAVGASLLASGSRR